MTSNISTPDNNVSSQKPDQVLSLIERSKHYVSSGQYDKACAVLRQSLLIGGKEGEIYNQLGYVNYCQRKYDAALDCYEMTREINPDQPSLLINLGLLYLAMGKRDIAETYFVEAQCNSVTFAEASLNLAKLALADQDYSAGWAYYQFRPNNHFREVEFPMEFTAKRILVVGCLDYWQALFYTRFLPLLVNTGANVSYVCGEDLEPLLSRNFKGVEVFSKIDTEKKYDLVYSVIDLPRLLDVKNSSSQSLPPPMPLMSSRYSETIIRNLLPNNHRENIAVVWDADSQDSENFRLRISPELLGESLRYTDANILILQKDPRPYDIKLLEKGLRRKVFNYGFVRETLDSTLAFMSEVDHYVGVGDYVIHLANDVNKNVSVLVSHPPQWHWLLKGEQSPWFSNFNLYRQDISGSWEEACANLKCALSG